MKLIITCLLIFTTVFVPCAANAQDWVRAKPAKKVDELKPVVTTYTESDRNWTPDPGSLVDVYPQGLLDGQKCAFRIHKDGDRVTGGVVAAAGLGIIGGAIAYGAASSSRELPPMPVIEELNTMSMPYQQGFIQGFTEQCRSMNRESASVGIIAGLGITVLAGLLIIGASR